MNSPGSSKSPALNYLLACLLLGTTLSTSILISCGTTPTSSLTVQDRKVPDDDSCSVAWHWSDLPRIRPAEFEELPSWPKEFPELEREQKYLKNMLIITGKRNMVVSFLLGVNQIIPLQVIDMVDFSYLSAITFRSDEIKHYSWYGIYLVSLDTQDLYELDTFKRTQLLNSIESALDQDIWFDIVYVQGAPWAGEGSPWAGEGSPWAGEGSPWAGEGSPWAGEGSQGDSTDDGSSATAIPATNNQGEPIRLDGFLAQWAFNQTQGNNLQNSGWTPCSQGQEQPSTIRSRIGIFDTSPFDEEGLWELVRQEMTVPICVTIPDLYVSPAGRYDVKEHGVFSSGLSYIASPQSEIHLIQVLNEYGTADLFTLVKSLDKFIQVSIDENMARSNRSDLTGTVINMSLGFVEMDIETEGENTLWSYFVDYIQQEQAEKLQSLAVTLDVAHTLGAVSVAAAGNNSAGQDSPLSIQYPAKFDTVLGVGASTQTREVSCYSDLGEIYAPAGNGKSDSDCKAFQFSCTTLGTGCPFGILSLATIQTSPTGFAYWIGTSFAAPQVAGLSAALIPSFDGSDPGEIAHLVQQSLEDHSSEGAEGIRIINITNTLNP